MGRRLAAAGALFAFLMLPAAAHADRAFSPRFTANTQGDIAFAANGVLTCVQAEPGCPGAKAGTGSGLNNNDRVMTYIDVDTNGATFNSSEADLTLAEGARVLFAGLYFGGRSAAGTGGLAAPGGTAARGTALIQPPGADSYLPVTASQIDESGSQQYQAFANVTDIVAGAGAGAYRVANVQVGTGKNASQAHGWALIVVYGDPAAPTRNLSVFDGFQNVGSGSPGVTIPLSGFQTPLSGTVTSTVGVVAQEGDRGTPGDGASIRGGAGFVRLSNAANPGNPPSQSNLFNSTISRAGVSATNLLPLDINKFGFDVDTFTTTNVLGNNQTSTDINLSTSGDAYNPGVVFISTDLYAPRIQATKTVDQAEADLGDELIYSATFQNNGEDGAAGFVVTDPIPEGTTYVPGSITINGVGQSDTAGNDQAEFDAAGNRVVARLGTGASPTAGGTLGIGQSSVVSFRVQIDDGGFPAGATIANTARAAFTAATTGQTYAPVDSAPAETRLLLPDIAVVKQHDPAYVSGGTSTILLAAFNIGEGPSTGETVVTDTLPAGLTVNGPILADGWSCAVAGQTITCSRSDSFDPQEPIPAILVPVQLAAGTPPGSLSNTATVTNPSDANTDNNSVTDDGAVSEPQFDLSVTKEVTSTPPMDLPGYPPSAGFGVPVTYELTITNDGAFPAENVQLTDVLPPALSVFEATPSQGSCSGAVCSLGTINPGATVTVQLSVSVTSDANLYPSQETLVNTAEVTATGNDVDPSNNTAEASIQTLPIAALSITKAFAPAQPFAGEPVTYTMEIRNDGPGIADVNTADLLPPELENPQISITGGTGDCTFGELPEAPGVPLGLCTVPQFEVSGTRTITLTGTLAPGSAGSPVLNRAAVAGSSVESDFSNNLAEVQFVPVEREYDLSVTKAVTSSPPPGLPGYPPTDGGGVPVTYDITIRNDGDYAATDVQLADVLPAALNVISAAPSQGTCTGASCSLGTIGPGEAVTVSLSLSLTSDLSVYPSAGTVVNRAEVTSAGLGTDVDQSNNASEAPIDTLPVADLSITKSFTPGQPVPGDPVTYTLEVRNDGPGVPLFADIIDNLPAQLLDPQISISGGSGDCGVGEFPPGTRVGVCSIDGFEAGGSRTIKLSGTLASDSAGSPVVNRATISGPYFEADPADNAAQAGFVPQVPVEEPPPRPLAPVEEPPAVDVAVDVTAPSAPHTVGEPGTWEIDVVNNGPGTATSVNLDTSRRGARADALGARVAQAGCRPGTSTSCALGDLGSGERRTIEVRLRPQEAERLTLAAEVTISGNDTAPANNTDEDSIRPRLATVALAVDVAETRLSAGEATELVARLRTRGRPANDARVCLRLPEELAISKAGGARLRNTRACWQLDRLAASRSRGFRLGVRALGINRARRVDLTATVTGPGIRTRRARVSLLVLPAQAPPGGVTG